MDVVCDLEVNVNGEETFLVDKRILSAFCGRLSKLTSKLASPETKPPGVILHDLPGGPEAFELVTRFCYNNGSIQMTSTSTCLLNFAAHFMEMTEDISPSPNLIKVTEGSLEGVPYWTWLDVLTALKQCQDCFPLTKTSIVHEKILDSLVGRIAATTETSPSGSSPESAGFRFSCDTKSTISTKTGYQRAWWFEDLVVFNCDTIERFIKCMVSRKLDQVAISRFLFYYLKCRFTNAAAADEKRKATEMVVDLLFSLERSCLSCKCLFGVLRTSSSLNLSKCCSNQLEAMIGTQLDQATLDNLLVPGQSGMESLYDVNLVLRFVKSFLANGGQGSTARLKRVGILMDLYIAEVAPDSSLKPSKFVAIASALPDDARDSHDAIYRAIDMYLEVHCRLSEEEKTRICCAIKYEKLSSESCKHLAQNPKFPSRTAIQAVISQQLKLKSLLQETNYFKSYGSSPHKAKQCNDDDQIILYAQKLDLSVENEKLRANLQGMQWKVMELEKVCRKMQTQMAKIMKTKLSSPSRPRSLPKLCS